ncbi:MAG: hypothetical protein E6I76_12670 [Chloroflexi bacterium]|nr:MAG: hypothetical protein E6I76_12670 [Chloroflexota bacterium]
MALNIDTATPSPRVSAKPLTTSVPKTHSTTQAIIVEMLLSRIAGHARRKPASTERGTLRPWRSSSRVRSKMSTLASTAMPSISTRPASPGRVKAAFTMTMKATVNTRLAISATQATMPAKR